MRELIKAVEDGSLQATPSGYQMKLRLKWYRSLPLSCVDRLKLSMDGKPVDAGKICLGINNHTFRLDELPELVEEFWFIQDSAILSVDDPGEVSRGNSHQIDLELVVHFPYIPIGPGKYLTHVHKYSATQVAG